MDTVNFVVFRLLPIAVIVAALIWAFGRKRKKRFVNDGRIPFQK